MTITTTGTSTDLEEIKTALIAAYRQIGQMSARPNTDPLEYLITVEGLDANLRAYLKALPAESARQLRLTYATVAMYWANILSRKLPAPTKRTLIAEGIRRLCPAIESEFAGLI
jgi:DNA-binding CsgD family transcriptional regulator